MTNRTAMIFDIQRNSFVDGPGIRTTLFFKGCHLRCAWCHNPEGQRTEPEWMRYPERCVGCGRCEGVSLSDRDFFCFHDGKQICGRKYTTEELFPILLKDKRFYETSGGGVTFSGGECMLQLDALEELLIACRNRGIHTAVDTAGDVPFTSFERILPYTDLFLYDLKCLDTDKHRRYTGVGNRRILDNLRRLLRMGAPLWVRIPVIPSVNDTEEEMLGIKKLLDSFGGVERVELLPYHAMGEHKYAAVGRVTKTFAAPDEELMGRLREIFA